MPHFLVRLAWFTLTLALTSALGCKGCEEGLLETPAPAQRAAQHDKAQLRARFDARKLDRSKVYPKVADGSTACGTDKDCFILQADACAPAELSYTLDMSGFGALQRVHSIYRIDGKEAGKCKVTRRVTAIGVQLSPGLIEVLRNRQGKSDSDIQTMKDDADETLRTSNPPLVECWFEQDVLVQAVLDLADDKYVPQVWRDECREVSANVPPPADAFEAPAEPTGGSDGTGGH